MLFVLSNTLHAQNPCFIVKSADFIDEDTGWIAGNNRIIKTDDGGNTWSHFQLNDSWDKHYIDFLDDEVGWAVRDETILKTVNGGRNWVVQKTFNEIPLGPALPFVVNDTVVYVASDREILITIDGGETWTTKDLDMELTSIWFFNQDSGIVTGVNGHCFIKRTSDGGNTWSTTSSKDIYEVYHAQYINDSTGFFIDAHDCNKGIEWCPGELYKTTDAMKTWEVLLNDVVSQSTTELGTTYALVKEESSTRVMRSIGNHDNWEIVIDELPDMDLVTFLDENIGYVIGNQLILKTTDGGDSWIDLTHNAGLLKDCIPPELTISSLHIKPDSVDARSTEDGRIYLVPVGTEPYMPIIQIAAIDSAEVSANEKVMFPASNLENGRYCMYAVDTSGNVSEPGIFIVKGVDLNDLSDIVILNDSAFLHALIDEGVDTNGDSLISYAEAEAVIELNVGGGTAYYMLSCHNSGNIKSLKGIEAFSNLERLVCKGNKINDTLDLSNNASLKWLWCSCSSIKYLDVSNTAVEVIWCGYNELTGLNVSNCPSLEHLDCSFNQLASLNISNCTSLTRLDCEFNKIANLDVSNCTSLAELNCVYNYLDTLDVSNCIALTNLECQLNQLTSLDVSSSTSLIKLTCDRNRLQSLNVSNCTALKELECFLNHLTSLDVSNCPDLTFLECSENQLTSLDVSNCTALTFLDCSENQLTSLDVSNNNALTELYCWSNRIANLDVSTDTLISILEIGDIPSLNLVCVWTTPFPPEGIHVYTGGSPNVYFSEDCIDRIAPKVFAIQSIYHPDSMKVTSTEHGTIYLVPVNTERELNEIQAACMDSVVALAYSAEYISILELENGIYWVYARDGSGNISEPKEFTIMGVGLENTSADQIRIFPNPVNDLITIESNPPGKHFIKISSLNGQIIYNTEMEGSFLQIDLSSIPKGLYLITVRSRDILFTEKIIKF
jgi:photosystem II stability/assembly factor-like uncharacterized protein